MGLSNRERQSRLRARAKIATQMLVLHADQREWMRQSIIDLTEGGHRMTSNHQDITEAWVAELKVRLQRLDEVDQTYREMLSGMTVE